MIVDVTADRRVILNRPILSVVPEEFLDQAELVPGRAFVSLTDRDVVPASAVGCDHEHAVARGAARNLECAIVAICGRRVVEKAVLFWDFEAHAAPVFTWQSQDGHVGAQTLLQTGHCQPRKGGFMTWA